MASLRKKDRSPYWFACFTLPDGIRTQRSTGSSDRRIALRIANEFEDAAKQASAGRLIEARARRTIADIFALANPEALPSSTIKSYLENWLKRKKIESTLGTYERYCSAIKHILSFLGSKINHDLVHFNSKEIAQMRDALATKLSPNSANFTVKVLRALLNQAKRDGFIEINEASKVGLIKRFTKLERRPFTKSELKRILDNADTEWRGMILVGLYTGLRLGDICTLTWNNVNLQTQEIMVVSQKTNRPLVIPMAKPLLTHLLSLPATDNPSAPLFRKVYEARTRTRNSGGVSNQFYSILVHSGLAQPRPHKSTGKGKDTKRQLNELSFHSLRHTATSLLKNAGVSDVVARDIIGHESEAISRNYTHIDTETKRRAIDSMPDVLEEPKI